MYSIPEMSSLRKLDFVLFLFRGSTTVLKSAWVSEDPARQRRTGNLSLKVQYSSAFFAGDILCLSVQEKNWKMFSTISSSQFSKFNHFAFAKDLLCLHAQGGLVRPKLV